MATEKEINLRKRIAECMNSSEVPDFPAVRKSLDELEHETKKRRKGVSFGSELCEGPHADLGEGAEVWVFVEGDVRSEIDRCICSQNGDSSTCRSDYPTCFYAEIFVYRKGRVEIEGELNIYQDVDLITHLSGKHSEFPAPTVTHFFSSVKELSKEKQLDLASVLLSCIKKKCEALLAIRYFPKAWEIVFELKDS